MPSSIESAIVRLYYQLPPSSISDKKSVMPVGCGIFLSHCRIITCAHVVEAAIGKIGEQQILQSNLILDFPFIQSGHYIQSRVEFYNSEEDIAGLELLDEPPTESKPVYLNDIRDVKGHKFEVVGFPKNYEYIGQRVNGVIIDWLANGWIQIEGTKELAYWIAPGFSGGPVLDTDQGEIIGMVTSKESDSTKQEAFITPNYKLIKYLKPSFVAEKLSNIWFSHREKVYLADIGQFFWTDEDHNWDWDNLSSIDILRSGSDRLKFVIRRSSAILGRLGKKTAELRFMFDFEAHVIHAPSLEEDYIASKCISGDPYRLLIDPHRWRIAGQRDRFVLQCDDDKYIWQYSELQNQESSNARYQLPWHLNQWRTVGPRERFVLQIDDDRQIWQHADKMNQKYFIIDEIYSAIQQNKLKSLPPRAGSHILKLHVKEPIVLHDNKPSIIPVIYQPAVDGMRGILEEVHCCPQEDNSIQVTLVFAYEPIRRHKWLSQIYEKFRSSLYGIGELESFIIQIGEDGLPNSFDFTDIYSGNNSLEEDSIHGDPKSSNPAPHLVRYYAESYYHPIVFVNTANHAMAEYDTNPHLWKWEFIPWLENTPVILGNKSRSELEDKLKSSKFEA
jgi:hypothetical protein